MKTYCAETGHINCNVLIKYASVWASVQTVEPVNKTTITLRDGSKCAPLINSACPVGLK